jgi:hypothetical protein
MKRIWILVCGVLLFVLIGGVEAKAEKMLYPSVDTYVDNQYPDSSFGSSYVLAVTNVESLTQMSYLMFDLSGIPSNAEVLSAYLSLYAVSRFGSSHPRVFRVPGAISGNMTWQSKPAYATDWYADGQGDGIVYWDVKEVVKSSLSTGVVSFCVAYPVAGNSENFYSKESSYPPALKIEYNTPPQIESYSFGPQTAEWGENFTFSVKCWDPDGDSLNVTLVLGGARLPMGQTSARDYLYGWTSQKEDIGTKSFYIEVSDGFSTITTPINNLIIERRSTYLSLSASSSEVRIGSTIRFQGTISPPLTGVPIKLTLVTPTGATREEQTSTKNGQFSFFLENFTKNDLGRWRAVASFVGNEYYKPSTSPEKTFEVKKALSVISAEISENLVRGDRKVVLFGTLNPPGVSGEQVVLSFWVGESKFEETVLTESGGTFSFKFEPSKLAEKHGIKDWTGEWRVTASWTGSDIYSGSQVSSSLLVLAPLWVEHWFPLASALSAGLLGGLTVAVIRARKTYAPPPLSKSKEKLVFEVKE